MATLPSLAIPHAMQTAPSPDDERLGVVDQVVVAFNLEFAHSKRGRKLLSRISAIAGFVFGGAVPATTYCEVHFDLNRSLPLHSQVATFLILGGLLFSAKTVYVWAKLAFDDGLKAAGFVVLLEGVMVSSNVPVLPLVLLALLVFINGVATACVLSLGCRKLTSAPAPDSTSPPAVDRLTPAVRLDPAVTTAPLAQRPAMSAERQRTLHRARVQPTATSSLQKHFVFADGSGLS